MSAKKGIVGIVILLIVFALSGIFFVKAYKKNVTTNKPASTPSPSLNVYESKKMQFSVDLPLNYQSEEKFNTVSLNSTEGKITITRNGTNFKNLTDYIKNSQNNLSERLKEVQDTSINGLNSKNGYLEKEKIYFIYRENWVYMLSSTSPNLYSDLDQIARSFRYIP